MFRSPEFSHLRDLFVDQFTPDRNNFLYRKSGKGAAIRVSAAERDAFIANFNKRIRYLSWSITVATLALITLFVLLSPDAESGRTQVAMYVGVGCIMAVSLTAYYWAWNQPMRDLDRRSEVAGPLDREQARRLGLSQISYGNLGFAVIAALGLVWKQSAEGDVLHGWGLLWPIFAGLIIVGVAIQAFRKWRSDRSA